MHEEWHLSYQLGIQFAVNVVRDCDWHDTQMSSEEKEVLTKSQGDQKWAFWAILFSNHFDQFHLVDHPEQSSTLNIAKYPLK